MVLIATLKDENYLGWDRTVCLNIKGIGRQADDICRRETETAARWKGRSQLTTTCQWATLRNCDLRELCIKDEGCIFAKY